MRAEPTPIEMVHELHTAVYGYSGARPESPERVWNELLDRVRGLAQGRCWKCMEHDAASSTEQNP